MASDPKWEALARRAQAAAARRAAAPDREVLAGELVRQRTAELEKEIARATARVEAIDAKIADAFSGPTRGRSGVATADLFERARNEIKALLGEPFTQWKATKRLPNGKLPDNIAELTLGELLTMSRDSAPYREFRDFCRARFVLENLSFLEDEARYRAGPTVDGARVIYVTYISEAAPSQVNIPASQLGPISNEIARKLPELRQ